MVANRSSKGRRHPTALAARTSTAASAQACPSCNVPDKILYSLSAEVLKLEQLDEEIFNELIEKIMIGEYALTFHFKDGHTEI